MMAEQLLADGADVIFPIGDLFLGIGAARAVQDHGDSYVIGVDTDWASSTLEYADVVLTSVEKRYDVSIIQAVDSIVEGNFQVGTHIWTLESGEIGLSPFYTLDGQIEPIIKAEIDQIKADIISGKIETK